MQRLGIDMGIVEGMLTGRQDALHLEGQPAAIARRVGEELNVVACGGKRGYMGPMLCEMGVGSTLVDGEHGDGCLQLVQL